MAPPTPSPSSIDCGIHKLPTNHENTNIAALVSACIISSSGLVHFAPIFLKESQNSYSCKSSLEFGLLLTFFLYSSSALIYSLTQDWHIISSLFELLWTFSALISRIWMILLFRHTLWVLNLPNRVGEFQTLLKTAQSELQLKSQRISLFGVVSITVCILFGLLKATVKELNRTFYRAIPVLAMIFCFVDFIMLLQLFYICYIVIFIDIKMETRNRMLYCFWGSLIATIVTTYAYIDIALHDSELYNAVIHDNKTKEYYYVCFNEFSKNYLLLPSSLSVLVCLLTLFPFTTKKLLQPIIFSFRFLADMIELLSDLLDDIYCCRVFKKKRHVLHEIHFEMSPPPSSPNNELNMKIETLIDFSLDFGLTTEEDLRKQSKRRNDNVERNEMLETGEQTIMSQVGSALMDTDTYSLVIPPEFIKINKTPFAAGGFGQVHKGVFCGKQVAVKKVFTQLSEGLLDEFKHEVSILNNLRGMPHIMLLHGVSFQIDQGERVFIMVLEWCPLSLSSLVRADSSPVNTFSSKSTKSIKSLVGDGRSSGGNWLTQTLLSNVPQDNFGSCKISPTSFLGIIKQLVNGLHMLHYKGYVHRDIKPQNILFTNPSDLDNSLRLCDFGTARITETGRCFMEEGDLQGISPLYSAPEVIALTSIGQELREAASSIGSVVSTCFDVFVEQTERRNNPHSYDGRAYDMYSLSIIMWECWYQREPELFPLNSDQDVNLEPAKKSAMDMMKQTLEGHRPSFRVNGPCGAMPSHLLQLVEALWSQDPLLRPTVAEVKDIIDSEGVREQIDMAQRLWISSMNSSLPHSPASRKEGSFSSSRSGSFLNNEWFKMT